MPRQARARWRRSSASSSSPRAHARARAHRSPRASPRRRSRPRAPRRRTAPASAAASAAASSATVHVAIVNKDMTRRRDQGRDRGRGPLTVGNWTYSATDELVNQFQTYVKDTYGADIKLNYVGIAAAERVPDQARRRRRRPATRRRSTSSRSRRTTGTTRPSRASSTTRSTSDLIPNQKLVLDGFKHAPAVDRVPVDGLPGRRLQQEQGGLPDEAHGPRRPAAQGQAHDARSRPTSPPAGSCSASPPSSARTTRTPSQMKEVVDWVVAEHRPERRSSTRPTSRRSQQLFESGAVDVGRRSGTASPGSSTSAATRRRRCSCPDDLPGQRLPVDPEGRRAPGPGPDLHELAARQGRPVPERLADRPRPVERAVRGLPRARLRRAWSPTGSRPTTTPTTRPSTRSRARSRRIDWKAYNDSAKVFQDYYAQKLGQ